MAVGQPLQRYFPALRVQKPRSRDVRDDGPDRGHGNPGFRGLRERRRSDPPGSRTGSRSRRRRKRWSRCRRLRAPAAPQPPATAGCSAHRSRRTRRTPRIAWRDRRQGRRTRPSRRWRDRARPLPAHCAAAARGSGRPASLLPRHRSPARRRPRRLSGCRARARHRRCVPVTTTRSPGFAPLRWTILPGGTRPNAVIEIISGPGVDTVSPPSSGQPNCAASSPSPRANGASQRIVRAAQRQRQHEARRCGALGGEIGEVHPQRLARDRVRRIVGQKMHAFDDGVGRHHDVVAAALQDRGVVVETERAGIGRERLEIARDQGVFAGWTCWRSVMAARPFTRHRPA